MRWKLIRRRLSISAPRMIVRSHLPWPLRWAATALTFGFSAALALWAFELGKDIAGIDRGGRDAREQLAALRAEVEQLRSEREQAQAIANTADSLLKAERTAQEKLVAQVRSLEAANLTLRGDLGFYERLLPAAGSGAVAVRGLHAEVPAPGQVRYQLLLMQPGRRQQQFVGSYELTLVGTLDGKPWSLAVPGGPKPLQFKQSQRLDGVVNRPEQAVVTQVQVKVMDSGGGVLATQSQRL